jgi:hypothetical protein
MLFLEHGQIGPERKRTKKLFSRIQPVHLEFAKAILEIAPTAYYYEICEVLRIQFGVIYCKQHMCDALNCDKTTRKVHYIISYNVCYVLKLLINVSDTGI